MTQFLSFSGSPSKFSRSGYLLWNIGWILEKRLIDFSAVHAVDLPTEDLSDGFLLEQFIAETVQEIDSSEAILLVVPFVKESEIGLLQSLFDRLPENAFSGKPVILFLMGGLATHIARLEQSLGQTLQRLGAPTIAARIHLRSNDWIQVRDDRPRLTRSAEVEVTRGLDFGIKCAGLRKLPSSRTQGATV